MRIPCLLKVQPQLTLKFLKSATGPLTPNMKIFFIQDILLLQNRNNGMNSGLMNLG